MKRKVRKIYKQLLDKFGRQYWWPAETPFEVMVGAILTQGANWKNVEKAIKNLKSEGELTPLFFYNYTEERLQELIRPSGFFSIKAKRLKVLVNYMMETYKGDIEEMRSKETGSLRRELLKLNGIGMETCDSILLYALDKPVFVVDTYTRRILKRCGISTSDDYEFLRSLFENSLKEKDKNKTIENYKEMHALLVELGKRYCKTSPHCNGCPLDKWCVKKEAKLYEHRSYQKV